MEEYCICGHVQSEHVGWGWEGEPTGCIYSEDGPFGDYGCLCEKFQLDNLRFVEDEAKRRNLIN